MAFDTERFDEFILENNVIGFFEKPITLKSGKQSHWYVNWRTLTADAYLLDQLTDFIVDYVEQEQLNPNCLYGVPEGATKTAIIAGLKLARKASDFAKDSHVLPMGRAKPKEHGDPKDRFFLGAPRGKTVVLEDTATTGGSAFQAIEQLEASGLPIEITHLLVLTHRMETLPTGETVEARLAAKFENRIQLQAMSRADTLLPKALERWKPSPEVVAKLKQELALTGG